MSFVGDCVTSGSIALATVHLYSDEMYLYIGSGHMYARLDFAYEMFYVG